MCYLKLHFISWMMSTLFLQVIMFISYQTTSTELQANVPGSVNVSVILWLFFSSEIRNFCNSTQVQLMRLPFFGKLILSKLTLGFFFKFDGWKYLHILNTQYLHSFSQILKILEFVILYLVKISDLKCLTLFCHQYEIKFIKIPCNFHATFSSEEKSFLTNVYTE